jgi:hypothetical protein
MVSDHTENVEARYSTVPGIFMELTLPGEAELQVLLRLWGQL